MASSDFQRQLAGYGLTTAHIFYKRPFNYYLVAAEYRFVGNQVAGAGANLAWAKRMGFEMVWLDQHMLDHARQTPPN